MKLEPYKQFIARLREHYPDLCFWENFSKKEIDDPIIGDDGEVITPDIVPNDEGPISFSELLGICGCGDPPLAAKEILLALRRCARTARLDGGFKIERGSSWPERRDGYSESVDLVFMYLLDNLRLADHGSSVYGSWLTEKGKLVEDLLTVAFEEEPTKWILTTKRASDIEEESK